MSKISAEALQHAYYRAVDELNTRDDCLSLHAAILLIGTWAKEYEAAEREQAVAVTDEIRDIAVTAFFDAYERRPGDQWRDYMKAALESVAPLLQGEAK